MSFNAALDWEDINTLRVKDLIVLGLVMPKQYSKRHQALLGQTDWTCRDRKGPHLTAWIRGGVPRGWLVAQCPAALADHAALSATRRRGALVQISSEFGSKVVPFQPTVTHAIPLRSAMLQW